MGAGVERPGAIRNSSHAPTIASRPALRQIPGPGTKITVQLPG